jgi:hypothetical protein
MDAASKSKARQAEIEAKKAKLEEMRRQRALKDRELHRTRDSLSDRTSVTIPK